MTRLDYFRKIGEALQTLKPYAVPKLGPLSHDSKAIAVNTLPTAPGDRYIDGSRVMRLGFDIQCKSPSQGEAFAFAEKVADLLDGAPEVIGAMALEIYQEPFLAYKTESGEYVYVVSFFLETIKER